MVPDFSKKYKDTIEALKHKIRQARLLAALTINAQMLSIYWEIGNTIAEQESLEGWGKKIVETLAQDLKSEFPEIKGVSPRNLRYMRDFALLYPYFSILQAVPAKLEDGDNQLDTILQANLAKLTWYHHTTLMDKVKNTTERHFYIQQTIQNGWSRDIMVHQIESGLYNRQGQISNNFKQTITNDQSELIQQIFKDPYKFDFIYLGKEAKERDLEDALTNQLTKFLLELGQWFSFMGRQYRLSLGEKEYFLDLLFYHTRLKRYIIIDLKINEFKPEYKGKMEFYMNLADEQLKSIGDEPSIGLILCKTKDGLVAEYALRDSNKPIGIAQYKISENLPDNIKGELPTIEELEEKLEKEYNELKSPVEKKLDSLKEKLAGIKTEKEIKEVATLQILEETFEKKIKPMFELLLNKLHELNEYFYSNGYGFQGILTCINNISLLEEVWGNTDFSNCYNTSTLSYKLNGFKKGGVDSFDIIFQMTLHISSYWYGFSIMGYNNQQPFLKKMYHEPLTQEDKQTICDIAVGYLSDEIERRVAYIHRNQ